MNADDFPILFCAFRDSEKQEPLWGETWSADGEHVVAELYYNTEELTLGRIIWLHIPSRATRPWREKANPFLLLLGIPVIHEACEAAYNWVLYILCSPLIWMLDLL